MKQSVAFPIYYLWQGKLKTAEKLQEGRGGGRRGLVLDS